MDRVLEIFRSADANNNGVIDRPELEVVLKKMCPGFTRKQIDDMITAADLNEDGVISYEEFVTWLYADEWPDEECFALSIRLHDRADTNFTGFVSVDEIMAMRKQLCEQLGLGDFNADEERKRLADQDGKAAGVDILRLSAWSSSMKPICKEVGADAFKEAVRVLLEADPVGEPSLTVGPIVGKVDSTSARILVEPDRDVTVSCSATKDGEDSPAQAVELELTRGRPSVFKFEGLEPSTLYTVTFEGARIFTDRCSFRTTPDGGWSVERGDQPHLAIVSCNKVYTSRALPRGSPADLWRNLETRLRDGEQIDYMLHLGDNVYNDHEWYLVEKGKKRMEGHSCKWGVAVTWLRDMEQDDWESKRNEIEELFRTAYRETWGHAPTRYVLANVPNLMLFDDHDIRDDFGDRAGDFDPTTMDRWLADIAYIVIKEYQKQLYEDIQDSFDFHHHCFGDVGFVFVDVRGCKTFHRVEGDSAPFLGKHQWRALEDSMEEGPLSACRSILMLMPVPIAYVTETATMVAGKRVVDDLLGQWSATEHMPEVPRFLRMCNQWRGRGDGREVLIVGGDVHEGGWTDIFKEGGVDNIRQLTTSAISNKMTKPHEALAVTLTRSAASFYDGRKLAGDWSLTHFDWTNLNNYALVDIRAGTKGQATFVGRLVASDWEQVKVCVEHSTEEGTHKEQAGSLLGEAGASVVRMVGGLTSGFRGLLW